MLTVTEPEARKGEAMYLRLQGSWVLGLGHEPRFDCPMVMVKGLQ